MASFAVHGLDELCADFRRVENVPEEVTKGILKAMAEKTKEAQARTAAAMLSGPLSEGITAKAIKVGREIISDTGGYIKITFSGSRTRANTTTRNAEIAFINEFGKKGQPARPFIKTANEQDGDEINDAGAKIFYNWLGKNGL